MAKAVWQVMTDELTPMQRRLIEAGTAIRTSSPSAGENGKLRIGERQN